MIDEKVLVEKVEGYEGKVKLNFGNRGDFEFMEVEAVKDIANQLAEESNKRYEPTIDLIEHGVEGYNLHLEDQYRMGYEDGAESVRAMLTYEESNNGWIPCSERLPEYDGWYLVTISRSNETIALEFDTYNNEWTNYDCITIHNIVAWQPLPAPYQPKEDKQK